MWRKWDTQKAKWRRNNEKEREIDLVSDIISKKFSFGVEGFIASVDGFPKLFESGRGLREIGGGGRSGESVINGSGETPVSASYWEDDQFGFHGENWKTLNPNGEGKRRKWIWFDG